MDAAGAQTPVQPADPSPLQARIKTVRAVFQWLGVLVCVLFAIQGVAVFTDTTGVQDFWQGCHWVSEGVLYITIGVCGCLMEVRALFASVRQHFRRFAVNRLALSVVYIWVGCYSMGGRIQARDTWGTVGKVTGILAWCVGVADILMSCCSDRSERPENTPRTPVSPSQASGSPRDRPSSRYASTTAPAATVPDDSPGANPFGADGEDGGSVTVVADVGPKNPFADDAPPGGWSTIGAKPFGAG